MTSLQSNEEEDLGSRGFRVIGMPLSAIAFLMLSAVIALIRAHVQLLGMDEYGFGLLGIARRSSLLRLIHIQLARPVSFDPIGYNALIYGVIHYFGTGTIDDATSVDCGLPADAGLPVLDGTQDCQ